MRFHILGLPHTVTSKEYNACAYTQKVYKFGKMMTERGHEVIHYGHEESDLTCDEHVTVVTNKDLEKAFPSEDDKVKMKNRGTAIMFPSFIPHSVEPVLSGTRYGLTAWFEGPKWR